MEFEFFEGLKGPSPFYPNKQPKQPVAMGCGAVGGCRACRRASAKHK